MAFESVRLKVACPPDVSHSVNVASLAVGARVNGFTDNYIGVTGGLNYTPIAGFTIRPEVRYDRSTSGRNINRAFDNGKDNDQILLSVSGIFRF